MQDWNPCCIALQSLYFLRLSKKRKKNDLRQANKGLKKIIWCNLIPWSFALRRSFGKIQLLHGNYIIKIMYFEKLQTFLVQHENFRFNSPLFTAYFDIYNIRPLGSFGGVGRSLGVFESFYRVTYFAFLTTYFAFFDHINMTYFGLKNHIKIQALVIRALQY